MCIGWSLAVCVWAQNVGAGARASARVDTHVLKATLHLLNITSSMFTSNYAYHNDLQRQCNQLVTSLRDHVAHEKMSLIVRLCYTTPYTEISTLFQHSFQSRKIQLRDENNPMWYL